MFLLLIEECLRNPALYMCACLTARQILINQSINPRFRSLAVYGVCAFIEKSISVSETSALYTHRHTPLCLCANVWCTVLFKGFVANQSSSLKAIYRPFETDYNDLFLKKELVFF